LHICRKDEPDSNIKSENFMFWEGLDILFALSCPFFCHGPRRCPWPEDCHTESGLGKIRTGPTCQVWAEPTSPLLWRVTGA